MRFSVWRPELGKYDYFESPPVRSDVESPKKFNLLTPSKHGLGVAPEKIAWTLPADAKHVGQGDLPVGRIAKTSGLSLPIPRTWLGKALLVVGGVYLVKRWRRRRAAA